MSYKAPRPLREIEQEYGQLVQRAGQVQYQIYALEKDLSQFNETLRDLNQEAYAVKLEEEKKRQTEAEAAKQSDTPTPLHPLPDLTSK